MDNNSEITRLTNEIKYLKQSITWYQNTYEKRSFAGLIKDRILKRTKIGSWLSNWSNGYHKIKRRDRKTWVKQNILCTIVNYNYNENSLQLRKDLSNYSTPSFSIRDLKIPARNSCAWVTYIIPGCSTQHTDVRKRKIMTMCCLSARMSSLRQVK